ncbi:hypothetical protein [Roseovarius confluentis]|uniref:hypothetical protein n=1 Tax=Roseovarius confluentis TaxID=1852027 RepID=UPI003BAC6374
MGNLTGATVSDKLERRSVEGGALAETFIEHAGRHASDNYAENAELRATKRIIRSMDRRQIPALRLTPDPIQVRLGIMNEATDFNELHRLPKRHSDAAVSVSEYSYVNT